MATRIILHGGNADRNTDKNDQFFREVIDGVQSETVKVLGVYFARPPHRWEDSYDEDQSTFKRVEREMGREVETRLATDDMDTFYADVVWADVLWLSDGIRGGAGCLDIKLLTHYSEDEPEQIEALQAIGDDLPIVMIREEEYVVINQPNSPHR